MLRNLNYDSSDSNGLIILPLTGSRESSHYILNAASSLLPQTSTATSANKENVPKAATIESKRGPKPKPRDPVTCKIIRLVD